jgi:hypothetical protein
MKIKVGDRVKFLNDTGSGEVTRIVDPKTALVQVDDGFEVPWMIKDLVVDAGRYDDDEEEESFDTAQTVNSTRENTAFAEQAGEDPGPDRIEDEEVLFAFVPDESSADFDAYLVNSSSYHLKYTIARQQEGELVLFHEGTLEPGVKVRLGTYRPGNLNDEEHFRIQGVFFNAGFYHHLPPLDVLIRVSATEMYDASQRRESDYFIEKAMLHTLHDWRKRPEPTMEIDAEALKNAMYAKGDVKPERPAAKIVPRPEGSGIEEVDLHIQHLVDNHNHMSNAEILEVQIARFRTALESAILHKTRRIVFIHGVGNGKLKLELRRILDREYSGVKYQDASFREYGFGATMVLIR